MCLIWQDAPFKETLGNNIGVDPSEIYECIAFVPLFRGTSKEFAEGVSRGHTCLTAGERSEPAD